MLQQNMVLIIPATILKFYLAHLDKGECRWCKWAQRWAARCFEVEGH